MLDWRDSCGYYLGGLPFVYFDYLRQQDALSKETTTQVYTQVMKQKKKVKEVSNKTETNSGEKV